MTVRVVDNTVLSNFSQGEQFRLLRHVFDELVSTPAVFREFDVGTELGRVPTRDWSASASPFMFTAGTLSNEK